ncbi:hypothetical protein RB2501_03630 [Robiginitalea biformata HTCC2501]|uniref:Uncharacterized protein n=1 Tax=Robiginitalea biformata (strain ATCC BAA-864 / DSM 15991 / KCTC 12146 / HTCC2501) TaxID=313596 RepID=A4CG96_ROBBH|nr:hypothetical protein RB2501_03630 [Robiginitalea biformata HTCC2501]
MGRFSLPETDGFLRDTGVFWF